MKINILSNSARAAAACRETFTVKGLTGRHIRPWSARQDGAMGASDPFVSPSVGVRSMFDLILREARACRSSLKNLSAANCFGAVAILCLSATPSFAESEGKSLPNAVVLPLSIGWYGGDRAAYISTEASDPNAAKALGATYVPRLANTVGTQAVDDIYTFANSSQGNVIASRPLPTGPNNTDPNYSPLWQVTTVTWKPGVKPTLLTSEEAVLDAANRGLVTLSKTNIIVNCPVVFTPSGGLFPNAKLIPFYGRD